MHSILWDLPQKEGLLVGHGVFVGRKASPCGAVAMDVCHYSFVQLYRMYNTERELKCELWLLTDNNVFMQTQQ